MEISIYTPESDSGVFRHHLSKIAGRGLQYWTICHNIDTFLTTTGKRIALFQIPYPWDKRIEHEIDLLYDHVDDILILCEEVHGVTVEFMHRYDREKITYFICGKLHHRLNFSFANQFLNWIITSVTVYRDISPSRLFDLRPWDTKPYMFDVLLGRKKPHRDHAYDFILKNNLDSQCIMTYLNSMNFTGSQKTNQNWIWETEGIDDLEAAKNITWSVERVKYHGKNVSVSQIMPIEVYNQTAYSLVCETEYENHYTFITEKTVKPILAQRLFITLGNRYTLKFLQEIGFKTFHGIIDESYDEIEAVTGRHEAALEQMRWLCQQDQQDILKRIRPIVQHNFKHAYTTDWYGLFSAPFSSYFFPWQVINKNVVRGMGIPNYSNAFEEHQQCIYTFMSTPI